MIMASLLSACNVKTDVEETQLGCENEKAKAILWVDRNGDEKLTKYGSISTVKVHANVYPDGTFRILSYCKKQKTGSSEVFGKTSGRIYHPPTHLRWWICKTRETISATPLHSGQSMVAKHETGI